MNTSAKVAQFELSSDDYRAMSKHVYAPGSGRPAFERLLWVAAVFAASFGMVLLGRTGRFFLLGMLAGFALMLVRVLSAQLQLQPRSGGAVLCRYDVQLTQGGVRLQTPNWTCDVPWHGIRAVEETAAHCFLRLDTMFAYTIPKRAFADAEASRQFIDFARDCASRAR